MESIMNIKNIIIGGLMLLTVSGCVMPNAGYGYYNPPVYTGSQLYIAPQVYPRYYGHTHRNSHNNYSQYPYYGYNRHISRYAR